MARTLVISGVVLLAAAALVLLPIRVPHSVSVSGRAYPAQEWTLLRDASGALGSVLRDNTRGTVESYSVNQFVRGDAVRVSFAPRIRPSVAIAQGDTIASIYSNETERQLSALTGDLATVLSTLDVYASGEKPSIVQQAEAQVERARERVRRQQAAVERLRVLRQNDHASAQELEFAEMELGVFRSELDIALAELETARTGEKPQQIELTRTEAEALRKEIQMLQDRLSMYTITAPISGIAVRSYGPDTLLTVKDNVSYVVVMPVPWNQFEAVEPEQTVEIRLPRSGGTVTSTIAHFGDTVHVVNGEAVVMATAFVTDRGASLIPGAFVSCSINTGSVSVLEYLRRVLS